MGCGCAASDPRGQCGRGARTQLAPAGPSQVTDLRFVTPALGSEGSLLMPLGAGRRIPICTTGRPSSSWLSHTLGSCVRGGKRKRMGRRAWQAACPAPPRPGPSPSAPPLAPLEVSVLKRGLCGKSGGGGHQSMHLPPARLCSLWPLQKPEVLALGWGCAASCFSCVDASDCGGNLGQPMYF